MMNDYITAGDTIIFSPEYEKPVNPELISRYKKIIFSDYLLNYELFDAYEYEYKNVNRHKFKFTGSLFNRPLTNSLTELFITHMVFGYNFN